MATMIGAAEPQLKPAIDLENYTIDDSVES